MLRFRIFLPLMAPVLAVIGWWWYTSRKKKEMAAPEDREGTAVHEALNGMVETSRAGLKVGEGNTSGLEENPILLATAEMLSTSPVIETQGRVDTSSLAHHRSFATHLDAVCLESSAQGMPEEQATPHLSNFSGDKAEEVETRASAWLPLPDDEQVAEDSESGTREELAEEPAVVTEEKQTLVQPPSHSPGTVISLVSAELTEAAGPKLETDKDMEPESVPVPFLDNLSVVKDQISQSTPEALCPKVVTATYHVPTILAPLSDMEAEGPPQQNSYGVPLQRDLALDPAAMESNGLAASLNRELITLETQEKLVDRLCDIAEEVNGRSSHPSNDFPLSSEPQCTVGQVVQDIIQTSKEVLCLSEEGRLEDLTEQMSNEMRPPVNDCSQLVRNEVMPHACIAPPAGEQVEEDRSSGIERGQKNFVPEDSPSSLGEPQTVTRTDDYGCSTGQLESTGEDDDRTLSDQSRSCISSTQTGTSSVAPEQAEQEDDHTSNRMQDLLQDGPFPEVLSQTPGGEGSQDGCSGPPFQEVVVDDATSHSRTVGLQKSLCPEDSLGEPQTDDATGTEDSGRHTGQLEGPLVYQSESTGVVFDWKQSDESSSCVLNTQTEMPCTAPDQVEQEDNLTSDRMQHLLQEHSYSEAPAQAPGEEASQNVSLSPPVQEMVADNATSHSRMTSLQKSPSPGATPLSQNKLHKEDLIGVEESGSSTCQSGDGAEASSPDHIPSSAVPKPNLMASSQASDGRKHSPARKSEPSLEEAHKGIVCRDERGNDADLRKGSHIVSKMEEDHSGELSSVALHGDPVIGRYASVDDRKLPDESSSCILSAATLEMPDQAQPKDEHISIRIQHLSLEGPISAASTEVSGNDASQNGPVQEAKNPSPETTLSSPDEPQILEDVTGTENSGCSMSQSEAGASSQDHVPSTALSCAETEQKEGHMLISATSQGLKEQGMGPEWKSEPSLEEGQQATLPGGEGGNDTDLQNGSLEVIVAEAALSGGGDSEVSSGCPSGTTEGPDSSGPSTCPQIWDLTVWEIQVPKLLVGRLIGKRGRYVSFLKQKSGAKIHISPRLYAQEFQICHIEGTKQQVHKALGLIKKKFEDLDLGNVYSPPASKLPSLPITSWLLLPDKALVDVTVVKVVSASRVFVQQPNHPSYPALSALNEDMRLCYSQPAPGLPSPTEAGVICAAPGTDGAWWRAQVISFHKDCDEAEIRYVDYGGYHRVKMGTLHQIRSDFVTLPFQGAEAVLSNLHPLPGEDGFSAEASAVLEEMTRGAPLLVQVTSYSDSGIPFIEMWKVVKEELVSVNRTLVDRGLASWLESF
ncbi:hypothetical protein COCON_G00076520 [Conger conger]|uniref:Tudor domain-containing protein n=1 Tax=Conger conger TaxID=82655 RepID=A0A9Q1I294_CONCO|nr:hypothetical protein COCON_G00076520 [Conger conger]